jgi:glutamine amidotransferase
VCRLVAYVGATTRVAPLVYGGRHSLFRQSWEPRELLSGSVNADGYGVVWYADGRPRRIAEARPIWQDPGLEDTLDALSSTCVVAALRNGTPGLLVDRAGLLPFTYRQWTFVLNGFVPDFRRRHMRALRAALPDHLYAELQGTSDAETLFLLAVAALENGAGPVEALCAAAGAVSARVGKEEAQLAMLLADGRSISTVLTSTVGRANSLYVGRRCAQGPSGTVLASEALDDAARWEPVPAHSAVTLAVDQEVEVRPVTG